MRFLPLLLVMALLGSCASPLKLARESLEKGNYDDAEQRFSWILDHEPNNVDASDGLKKAREGLISQHLIRVRMSRMGGNIGESLDLLADVIDRENRWKLFPGGNVAFTQTEEIGFATEAARARVGLDLHDQHPLRADAFLRKYELIFRGDARKVWESLRSAVSAQGRTSCLDWAKKRNSTAQYFAEFVSQYCQYFGTPAPSLAVTKKDVFFNEIELEPAKADAPVAPQLSAVLTAQLQAGLQQTAWYDAAATNVLSAKINSLYTEARTKEGLVLTQAYFEQEPYTEMVTVQHDHQVPYVVNVGGAQVTQYRNEPYTTTEPQTRYRSVQREYRYPAWKHEQKLELTLSGAFPLGGRSLDVALEDRSQTEGIEHNENQPQMGLRPHQPNLPDPAGWLKDEVLKFNADFQNKAQQLWRDLYCQTDSQITGETALADRALKCARQLGVTMPSLIEDWTQKNLGLSALELRTLLK
ncbi:MAG: hypothetical protein ACXWPM_02390 [Bdellovibrionota bacterium]